MGHPLLRSIAVVNIIYVIAGLDSKADARVCGGWSFRGGR